MTAAHVSRFVLIAAVSLAACVPPPPNDVSAGVGFQDYQDFLVRQAELRGGQVPGTNITQPALPVVEAEAPSDTPDTEPAILLEEPEVRSVGLPPVYLPLPDG